MNKAKDTIYKMLDLSTKNRFNDIYVFLLMVFMVIISNFIDLGIGFIIGWTIGALIMNYMEVRRKNV